MIQLSENGYYGSFGGAYIPEMLYPNVKELQENYLSMIYADDFQREFYYLLKDYVGRPTPLYLAENLSAKHNATIYLKREDLCHTGAHKINNTIGQILLAKKLNKKRIIAETGAGQHGVATATVCARMGLECIIYMGAVDIKRQAPNVARMKMLGATVISATSGIISEEMKSQLLEATGRENPDLIIACVGGGSNAAGAYYHYLNDLDVRLIAVEAAGEGVYSGKSAATSILGTEGIIHGSRTLLMQTTDGQIVEPHSISAGLDYPGIGPLHAHLITTGRAEAVSVTDENALKAAFELSRIEGIIPALETAHAIHALEDISFKSSDVIVINLSGRGDKDLNTYMEYLDKY